MSASFTQAIRRHFLLWLLLGLAKLRGCAARGLLTAGCGLFNLGLGASFSRFEALFVGVPTGESM